MADLWQEIQDAIYYGGAVAADILSPPHEHYRPVGVGPALDQSNRVTPDLPFLADRLNGGFKFSAPSAYGKPSWQALVDGNAVEVGDYFHGASGTWFIAAKQPLLPILAVQCNRTVTLRRVIAVPSFGVVGQGGTTAPTALVTDWPCSILQGTKGEHSVLGLPRDTRQPWFSVLLPAPVGIAITTEDTLLDDLGQAYEVSSAELTDLGWRLSAELTAA